MTPRTHDLLLWLAGIGGAILIVQVVAGILVWLLLVIGLVFAVGAVAFLLALLALVAFVLVRSRLEPAA